MPILRKAFAEFFGSLWKLSVSLPELKQNAFYESVLGRSAGRV
ncbi:hypothetical protein LEP1GSC008_4076 [Leptospira kirschneri serovar Bulgarica str. Nikolaevo]|uniref:Uncharacterized protein n=1 Tax=Leptospira kirschneri serovar Bulgarica str. Nikolaevo TaxID=1240687 RepID=M6F779_9LEPT|nr:hypothetical protein LEP1GSC008_4076 [Leptospira kirschneri serovar Bulgarica str. Nikolaevo]